MVLRTELVGAGRWGAILCAETAVAISRGGILRAEQVATRWRQAIRWAEGVISCRFARNPIQILWDIIFSMEIFLGEIFPF